MNRVGVQTEATAAVMRARNGCGARLKYKGTFHVVCLDRDGKEKWRDLAHNAPTTAGLTYLLRVGFNGNAAAGGADQINPWYVGLVSQKNFTQFAAADVMSSHPGWEEEGTSSADAYDETTRRDWGEAQASAAQVTNSTTVDFSINGTADSAGIKGIFLASANTKGGTAGTLWATAAFSGGVQQVSNGDTLKVTYTITISGT